MTTHLQLVRNNRSRSAVSAAYSAFATLLFGCMTTSHPADISRRWQRTISRTRRRMRLRSTAPPSAFLMLNPKRLCGNWFARKKTVKWEFERRFPAQYTASNSPRRTSRASRGKSCRPALYGSEPMTALLAARRQHLAASGGLHARTETVRLGAPALARLIGALWQSNPPYILRIAASQISGRIPQAASAALCESVSVVDPRAHGQESGPGGFWSSQMGTKLTQRYYSPLFCYTNPMPEVKVLNEKLLAGLRPGTWVAISEDQERIVGTGATIEEALQQAKEKGEKKPSIIGVPVDGSALIL